MEEWRKRAEPALTWWKELPSRSKILMSAGVALAVAAGIYGYAFATSPSYSVLFANLPEEDTAEIVTRLEGLKIPYRVADGGRAIKIPEQDVYSTRLTLAGEGLPSGGAVGFEIFDQQRFGESEFSEHIKYHRALEGELARTISHLSGVERARVHLVLPERTLFLNKTRTASASVALQLKPGWTMREERVAGIVNLVASSVRGLDGNNVTVVDGQGRQLNKKTDIDGHGVADSHEFRRKLEQEKADAIQQLLDRTVGPGKAHVSVAADVNFTREERTEELFDPETVAPRSFQVDEERDPNGAGGTAGVPGAVSNLPGGDAPPGAQAQQGMVRRSETRNFEVSKTVRRAIEPVGRLRRLHVAVVVDGDWEGEGDARKFVPRPPSELTQLRTIIASAVGIDEERGDQLTVECVPLITPAAPELGPQTWVDEMMPYAPHALAGLAGLVLLLVGLVFMLLRRRKKKKKGKDKDSEQVTVKELPGGTQGGDGSASGDPELALPEIGDLEPDARAEDIRLLASELSEKDPEMAARVIRSWLVEDLEAQAEQEGEAAEAAA